MRAVLCDFGLVRIFLDEGSSGMTTTTAHTGTERYLAPELVNGNDMEYPTAASDIYALGCLGLEASVTIIPTEIKVSSFPDCSLYSIKRSMLTGSITYAAASLTISPREYPLLGCPKTLILLHCGHGKSFNPAGAKMQQRGLRLHVY